MIDQVVIGACGLATVWLSQDPRADRQRWACIFGLLAAPFWLWATWKAQQWGIFTLSVLYAIGWARGVRTYWWRR